MNDFSLNHKTFKKMTGKDFEDPKIFKGAEGKYALLEKSNKTKDEPSNDFLSKYNSIVTAEDFEFEIENGTNMEIEVSKIIQGDDFTRLINVMKNSEASIKTSDPEVGDVLIERFKNK